MGSDRVLKECISRDSPDPVIDTYALWLFSQLFGTSFLCFLPFMACYDAFELLYSRPFGQNHFFLISLTGVIDIVISKLPFIQTVCLNTSLFILNNMFMLYRYLKSLRCYNILTRQRVSNKVHCIGNPFINANQFTDRKSSKGQSPVWHDLHFIIIDHVSRCMRIKAANNM